MFCTFSDEIIRACKIAKEYEDLYGCSQFINEDYLHDIKQTYWLSEKLKDNPVKKDSEFETITLEENGEKRTYLINYNAKKTDESTDKEITMQIPEGITDICPEFMNLHNFAVKEVILPSTVKKIWMNAFRNSCALKKITLNEGLQEIQIEAFKNSEIEEIYIPDSVKTISNKAFELCTSLKKVHLPKHLERISYMMFYGCKELEQIEMPEETEEIASGSFFDCRKLHSITVPKNIKGIHVEAFRGSGIENLERNEKYEFVIKDGFCYEKYNSNTLLYYTGSAENVVIPSSFSKIAKNCFTFNANIESVFIPKSVSVIEEAMVPKNSHSVTGAFSFCESLEKVIFEEGSSVTHIPNYCFYRCSKLNEVSLPAGLVYVGNHGFAKSVALKKIDFPSKVQIIGTSAFSGCSLEKVILPESVEFVYLGAFYKNTELSVLEIKGENVFLNDGAFMCCDSLAEKKIPQSTTFGKNVFLTSEEEKKIKNDCFEQI